MEAKYPAPVASANKLLGVMASSLHIHLDIKRKFIGISNWRWRSLGFGNPKISIELFK
jgi:hypothetical protein